MPTHHRLTSSSVQPLTETRYDKNVGHWLEFCRHAGRSPYEPTNEISTLFAAYLFKHTTVPHGVANKIVTSLSHFFARHNVTWKRPDALKKALNGFRAERPSEKRPRKPFCMVHLHRIHQLQLLDLNDFNDLAVWAVLLTYYWSMLRGSEGCGYRKKGRVDGLPRSEIRFQWSRDKKRLIQLVVNLPKHKGDKHGLRDAHIHTPCFCKECPALCGVHILHRYVQQRDARFRNVPTLFLLRNGARMTHRDLTNAIRNLVTRINEVEGLQLKVIEYAPHSIRAGRTTDMARVGISAIFIRRQGRWKSMDTWDQQYNKLDFSELSDLTGTTLAELGLSADAFQEVRRTLNVHQSESNVDSNNQPPIEELCPSLALLSISRPKPAVNPFLSMFGSTPTKSTRSGSILEPWSDPQSFEPSATTTGTSAQSAVPSVSASRARAAGNPYLSMFGSKSTRMPSANTEDTNPTIPHHIQTAQYDSSHNNHNRRQPLLPPVPPLSPILESDRTFQCEIEGSAPSLHLGDHQKGAVERVVMPAIRSSKRKRKPSREALESRQYQQNEKKRFTAMDDVSSGPESS